MYFTRSLMLFTKWWILPHQVVDSTLPDSGIQSLEVDERLSLIGKILLLVLESTSLNDGLLFTKWWIPLYQIAESNIWKLMKISSLIGGIHFT